MGRPRDTARSAVYGAEDLVGRMLDRGGVVDFHGSTLQLPPERRFGSLSDIRDYISHVRSRSWGHGDTPDVQVVALRSKARAQWTAPGTLSFPPLTGGGAWAARELVVLHEYAHHVVWHAVGVLGHGPDFCRAHAELVRHAVSPEAGTILLASYHEAGLLRGS